MKKSRFAEEQLLFALKQAAAGHPNPTVGSRRVAIRRSLQSINNLSECDTPSGATLRFNGIRKEPFNTCDEYEVVVRSPRLIA
jgi:hypothetical protein